MRLVVGVVRAQLEAVALGHGQGDFQRVDGIQAELAAEQRGVGCDLRRRDAIEVEALHQQCGQFLFGEALFGHGKGRKSGWRRGAGRCEGRGVYHTGPIAPTSGHLPLVNSTAPPALDAAGAVRGADLPPNPAFAYRDEPLAAALAWPDTLAVLGFGARRRCPCDDARYLRVGLTPLGTAAPLEVWRAPGAVYHGRDGALRWASDGDWLFGALELDEAEHGGIACRQRCRLPPAA